MAVSSRHLLQQGPVLRALLGVAVGSALPRRAGAAPQVPGPWFEAELRPRPEALIFDYVQSVGGEADWYRGRVPAHLFPQWVFPLAARSMRGLPYPLGRALNAGCRITQHAPLPRDERLLVKVRLESIDDDGKRALITQRAVTGTRSSPNALECELRAYVPLAKREGAARSPQLVATNARELGFYNLAADAGLDFAKLTGDFNPIHWLRPAARAAGFRSVILHGFATLARAIESVNRTLLGGDVAKLRSIDARFTRPLPLPAKIGIYERDGSLWAGDGPGGLAYLEAQMQLEKTP